MLKILFFFEHKSLYRSVNGEVPENYFTIPIGKGKIVTEIWQDVFGRADGENTAGKVGAPSGATNSL